MICCLGFLPCWTTRWQMPFARFWLSRATIPPIMPWLPLVERRATCLWGGLSPRRQKDPFSRGFRLLSAFGLSKARIERILERQVLGPIDPHEISKIEKEMLAEVIARGRQGDRGELIGKPPRSVWPVRKRLLSSMITEPRSWLELFGRNSPRSSAISPKVRNLNSTRCECCGRRGARVRKGNAFPKPYAGKSSPLSSESIEGDELQPRGPTDWSLSRQ